jgi:hypothetical protein
MAPIQCLGEPQDRRQPAHRTTTVSAQIGKLRVRLSGFSLAVIPGGVGENIDLVAIKGTQVSVLDDVVRVLGVLVVADNRTDVMKKSRIV